MKGSKERTKKDGSQEGTGGFYKDLNYGYMGIFGERVSDGFFSILLSSENTIAQLFFMGFTSFYNNNGHLLLVWFAFFQRII